MTREQLNKIQIAEVVKERLRNYDEVKAKRDRERLSQYIAEAHPLAAMEVSEVFQSLTRNEKWIKQDPSDPDEYWHSSIYDVALRRHRKDPVFNSKGGMIQLGISAVDGTAKHDFRDMQEIKNQLAGPECEAFELYPAESRLLDPSNYYSLWCFPSIRRLNIGQNEHRRVWDQNEAMAPQRGLAKKP
jgi:hypothetical protein